MLRFPRCLGTGRRPRPPRPLRRLGPRGRGCGPSLDGCPRSPAGARGESAERAETTTAAGAGRRRPTQRRKPLLPPPSQPLPLQQPRPLPGNPACRASGRCRGRKGRQSPRRRPAPSGACRRPTAAAAAGVLGRSAAAGGAKWFPCLQTPCWKFLSPWAGGLHGPASRGHLGLVVRLALCLLPL